MTVMLRFQARFIISSSRLIRTDRLIKLCRKSSREGVNSDSLMTRLRVFQVKEREKLRIRLEGKFQMELIKLR